MKQSKALLIIILLLLSGVAIFALAQFPWFPRGVIYLYVSLLLAGVFFFAIRATYEGDSETLVLHGGGIIGLAAIIGAAGYLGYGQKLGLLGLLALFGLIGYCIFDSRTRHIARLTWRAAFRFRFFWVMAILLLLSVVGLPLLVKGDGTAEGLTQILITYTLSMVFFFLGVGTLWLSAGTMARDIEDAQMQMIATKPIARWQIWMGKWIGIMALNVTLLVMVGVAVFGMVEYRAYQLTDDEFDRIKDQSDSEIFQSALKAGIDVFQRDKKTLGFVKASGDQPLLKQSRKAFFNTRVGFKIKEFIDKNKAQPLLKTIEELRSEVAGLEEKKLRKQLLIGRAKMMLEDVQFARTPTTVVPLEDSYQSQITNEMSRLIEEEMAGRLEAQRQIQASGGLIEVPQKLSADEIAVYKNRAELLLRIRMQVMEPGRGFQFRFAKPEGFDLPEDERLILKFEFTDARQPTSSNEYGMVYVYGPKSHPDLELVPRQLAARSIHALPLHGHMVNTNKVLDSIFGTDQTLYVTLVNATHRMGQNPEPALLKLPFINEMNGKIDPTKVQVMYRESGFAINFIRALGILLAWLGIFAALGLLAAGFMSFPMAAFSCLAVLAISLGTGVMKQVLDEGTIMNTYTFGERDKSYVDWYAIPAFTVLVTLIEPVKDFSPIDSLSKGESVTWGELTRAYSFCWGITGWLLGLFGVIVFSRRQLAINGAQAP